MEKIGTFSYTFYSVYAVISIDREEYLGTVPRLNLVLDLCRSHVPEFNCFSIYTKITDSFGSEVFLGCLSSTDLNK